MEEKKLYATPQTIQMSRTKVVDRLDEKKGGEMSKE